MDKLNRCNYYVGADNVTGLVDHDRIDKVLSIYFDGWTRLNAFGYWQGKQEETALIIVYTPCTIEECKVIGTVLCMQLKQAAIMMDFNGDVELIS